jgi:hypothetical protein
MNNLNRYHIALYCLLAAAGFSRAQDSLYWECDTTSREYRSRFENQQRLGPVYDPTLECAPSEVLERKGKDGVTEWVQYCLQGGLKVKNGQFESRYPSKAVKETGNYAFDKKVGEWVTWYPDGKKQGVARYVDGKQEGVTREYWPDGKVKDEFKYHQGRIDCADGYHRSYHGNGRLKVDFGVADGRLVRYVIYDSRGKRMSLPAILKD